MATAKIKGSPFQVDVKPFYTPMPHLEDTGRWPIGFSRFSGFVDEKENVYAPDELEFLPPKPDSSALLKDQAIPNRVMNCLRYAWWKWDPDRSWESIRVSDLADHTQSDYCKIRNFGKHSLRDLCDLMEKYGLKFKGEE